VTSHRPVCVVVPVYRTALAKSERAALERCIAVLGAHPIAIVKPAALDLGSLLHSHPQLVCESFADRYFADVAGYNELMLSDSFYARFGQFEYVLIHQLDAWVFRDDLLAWCDRGFDYIGAPWLADPQLPSRAALVQRALRRRMYRWLNRRARREPGMHYTQYAYSSGNGGFSLRRVARMREVLAKLHIQAETYRRGDLSGHHEDLFFCVEANRYWNRVQIPDLREAAHFAWELQPLAASTLTHGQLPFGAHGWDKLHRDEWRPFFQRSGVALDELLA
jgi:hypothetical protein